MEITYGISDDNLAEITDNVLTATASGTVIVSLTQKGNNNYLAAETVNVEITILDVTGLNDITAHPRQAIKQLRNGHLYIIKGEAVYTADGMRTE